MTKRLGILLNTLAAVLVTNSLQPAAGLEIVGVMRAGHRLRLRAADRPQDLGIIHALYGTTPPVWQALWPDRENRYPDNAHHGCLVGHVQPLL